MKALLVLFLFVLILICFLLDFGMGISINKPAMDVYIPSLTKHFWIRNMTNLRIIEAASTLLGIYLVRYFPDDLKINQEYMLIVGANFFFNWYFEVRRTSTPYIQSSRSNTVSEACGLLNMRPEFAMDLLRSALFPLFLFYYTNLEAEERIPPDRMHVLLEFMHDRQCERAFRHYLRETDPDSIDNLDDMLRSLLEDTQGGRDRSFCNSGIESNFKLFKKTRSYFTLHRKRTEQAIVDGLGYTVHN